MSERRDRQVGRETEYYGRGGVVYSSPRCQHGLAVRIDPNVFKTDVSTN